ncbi:hypothetical protein BV898_13268 [Hypsibius exemplaris]|uniref:BOD1/SHG1 domain-containing protein n=1 Tax=Hypsibius exemplaris TaxID=2072580 RepID=A0A1W0WBB5_HYPEX|nr:hypothetical protein BV898_13268 [Hypsibius exemplaris]
MPHPPLIHIKLERRSDAYFLIFPLFVNKKRHRRSVLVAFPPTGSPSCRLFPTTIYLLLRFHSYENVTSNVKFTPSSLLEFSPSSLANHSHSLGHDRTCMISKEATLSMDSTSVAPPAEMAGPSAAAPPMETCDEEEFDIDLSDLLELYKRIPPPDLRGHALRTARERVVGNVVRKVKEDGIFDSFRKAWLKDLETKPQFQNLIRRVEIKCSEHLGKFTWSPDLNKAHLREELQKSIDKFDFVDAGIQDLLQEFNTGHYANPIPKQRFEESVLRVVSQTVQRYIQTATPSFPRLKSTRPGAATAGGTCDEETGTYPHSVSPDSYDYFDFPSYNPHATWNGLPHSYMRSKSPDMVDMEISSPESNADREDNQDVRRPSPPSKGFLSPSTSSTGFSPVRPGPAVKVEHRNGWQEVTAATREDVPPSVVAPPASSSSSTVENNDDLQGALGLLMLATGSGDWGSYGDDEEASQGSRSVDMELEVPQSEVLMSHVPPPPPETPDVSASPATLSSVENAVSKPPEPDVLVKTPEVVRSESLSAAPPIAPPIAPRKEASIPPPPPSAKSPIPPPPPSSVAAAVPAIIDSPAEVAVKLEASKSAVKEASPKTLPLPAGSARPSAVSAHPSAISAEQTDKDLSSTKAGEVALKKAKSAGNRSTEAAEVLLQLGSSPPETNSLKLIPMTSATSESSVTVKVEPAVATQKSKPGASSATAPVVRLKTTLPVAKAAAVVRVTAKTATPDLTDPVTPPSAVAEAVEAPPSKPTTKPALPAKRKSSVTSLAASGPAKKSTVVIPSKIVMRIDPPLRPTTATGDPKPIPPRKPQSVVVTPTPPPAAPTAEPTVEPTAVVLNSVPSSGRVQKLTVVPPPKVPVPVAPREDPAASELTSVDPAARPTRNRKSNSKYSNDNFVTELPKLPAAVVAPVKRAAAVPHARKGKVETVAVVSDPPMAAAVDSADRTSPISVGGESATAVGGGETTSVSSSETAAAVGGERRSKKKKT